MITGTPRGQLARPDDVGGDAVGLAVAVAVVADVDPDGFADRLRVVVDRFARRGRRGRRRHRAGHEHREDPAHHPESHARHASEPRSRSPRRKVGRTVGPMTESLPAVGRTAVGVAACAPAKAAARTGCSTIRYAAAFFTAGRSALPGRTGRAGRLGAFFASQVVIRTRFFDEYLLGFRVRPGRAARRRARRARVPAGLAGRAPGCSSWTCPRSLAFKDGVLAEQGAEPSCERIAVRGRPAGGLGARRCAPPGSTRPCRPRGWPRGC